MFALVHTMYTGRAAVSGPNRDAQKPRRNSEMAAEQQGRVRRGRVVILLIVDGSPNAVALLAAAFD